MAAEKCIEYESPINGSWNSRDGLEDGFIGLIEQKEEMEENVILLYFKVSTS